MSFSNMKTLLFLIGFLFVYKLPLASTNKTSVEFFASNNTSIIDIRKAYGRLIGQAQIDLQNTMIEVLQKHHIEQGHFTDILGSYRMSTDHTITADNTEEFDLSPYQYLSDEQIFSIAKKMAWNLKQDSIAVLIPGHSRVGEVTLNFTCAKPNINEALHLLQEKLPSYYSEAFSIQLTVDHPEFEKAKVTKIAWLGSKINRDEVKNAFPLEQVSARHGRVYLVYKNGKIEQL